ncbi:MAG: CRP-like cAMP-binding protein [Cryomorphaceae bacterium]|jgi:CRP-like cAMP-binding protein
MSNKSIQKGRIFVSSGLRFTGHVSDQSGPGFQESGKISGQRLRLRKYLYGSIVGHIAMLLGTPRSASVIADNDVVAYTLDRESMAKMQQETPLIYIVFQAALLKITAINLLASNRLHDEVGA